MNRQMFAKNGRRSRGIVGGARRAALATATVGAIGAATLLMTCTNAMASSGVCNPSCSAYAEFASDGEILTIHDNLKDNVSTIAILEDYIKGFATFHTVVDRNGFDGPPASVNLSFPEGTEVYYKACLGTTMENSHSCSGWRTDHA